MIARVGPIRRGAHLEALEEAVEMWNRFDDRMEVLAMSIRCCKRRRCAVIGHLCQRQLRLEASADEVPLERNEMLINEAGDVAEIARKRTGWGGLLVSLEQFSGDFMEERDQPGEVRSHQAHVNGDVVGTRIQEIALIACIAAEDFNGDTNKVRLWFELPNPMPGNISPRDHIRAGRYHTVLSVIRGARAEQRAVQAS